MLDRCDGPRVVAALAAAGGALEASRDEIDALNVFPVPDGDTGTNMSLTWQAACAAATSALEMNGAGAAALLQAAAGGALLHARGSSGLILSQLLAGAAAAQHQADLRPGDLVSALEQAAETARHTLLHPVEGTILSVAGAAAEGAAAYWQSFSGEGATWAGLLAAATSAARAALERTPQQLAVLAAAGRVDAGGRGYLALLEGLLDYAASGCRPEARPRHGRARDAASLLDVPARASHQDVDGGLLEAAETPYGYCTQFLIKNPRRALASLRVEVGRLGDQAQVVGTPQVVRVHVHTADPGAALTWAARLGRLDDVRVEDMQAQHQRWHTPVAAPGGGRGGDVDAPAGAAGPQPSRPATDGVTGAGPALYPAERAAPVEGMHLCAVVAGAGYARICAELGADAVSSGSAAPRDGGRVETLAAEIAARRRAGQPAVWLVGEDTGLARAEVEQWAHGQQGASSPAKHDESSVSAVHVCAVPTSGHAVAVLLALRHGQTVEEVLDSAGGVAEKVRAVNLAAVWRQAAPADGVAAAVAALAGAGADGCEVISLYRAAAGDTGGGATQGEQATARLVDAVRAAFPGVEVEVLDGGQAGGGWLAILE
jgi:dihydroxyacetone kinase-like predicted kinase